MLKFVATAKVFLWEFVELAFLAVLALVLLSILLGKNAGGYVESVAENAAKFSSSASSGVLGIVLNRVNVSIVAFNWQIPLSERYVPKWMEVWVSITLVTIGVLAFRWIANRMPILREDPEFAHEGHAGTEAA